MADNRAKNVLKIAEQNKKSDDDTENICAYSKIKRVWQSIKILINSRP